MHFPSFFIPFQSFFSPNLLFGHIFAPRGGGGKQINIHPWYKDLGNTFVKYLYFLVSYGLSSIHQLHSNIFKEINGVKLERIYLFEVATRNIDNKPISILG